MQREKLSKIHQVVLGIALALAFIGAVEALRSIDEGVSIRLDFGADDPSD